MPRRRTWTDDDLRTAVETATTLAEVVRRLRLSRGGAAYVTVRTRMEQLGLELPVTPVPETAPSSRHRRSWDDDDLRCAVVESRSLADVFHHLGLVVGGSQWLVMRQAILSRGLATDHWVVPLGPPQPGNETATFSEVLAEVDLPRLVRDARTRADVIRALGHQPTRSTYRLLANALDDQAVSTAHFDPSHAAMRRTPRTPTGRPLDEILVRNSTYVSLPYLKRRLVAEGLLVEECAVCGITDWCGQPLALHLDHINGVRDDHRLSNLRLLCPNCHSQTPTYAGRNKGRRAAKERG